jgi:hypothetical protein
MFSDTNSVKCLFFSPLQNKFVQILQMKKLKLTQATLLELVELAFGPGLLVLENADFTLSLPL